MNRISSCCSCCRFRMGDREYRGEPWALSRCETAIHLIPVIGFFTSGFCLAVSFLIPDRQVRHTEEISQRDSASTPLSQENGGSLDEESTKRDNRATLWMVQGFAMALFAAIWGMATHMENKT